MTIVWLTLLFGTDTYETISSTCKRCYNDFRKSMSKPKQLAKYNILLVQAVKTRITSNTSKWITQTFDIASKINRFAFSKPLRSPVIWTDLKGELWSGLSRSITWIIEEDCKPILFIVSQCLPLSTPAYKHSQSAGWWTLKKQNSGKWKCHAETCIVPYLKVFPFFV